FTGSEDDNVLVQGIASNKNALGYFGFAYYTPNADRMKAVPIVGKSGKPVLPSLEIVSNGPYEPLSRPLFIYVSEKGAQRPEVREFVQFYLTQSKTFVGEVGYMPLPDNAYQIAADHFKNGKLGTGFGGVPEVGLRVEELLARE